MPPPAGGGLRHRAHEARGIKTRTPHSGMSATVPASRRKVFVTNAWRAVTVKKFGQDACGRCVTDAMGKAASTTPGARLKRELRQRRATTAAAEARRAARRRHAERARRARAEIIVARCPEIIVARCRPHRAAS